MSESKLTSALIATNSGQPVSRLEALRALENAIIVPTSYTSGTPEVQAMLSGIEEAGWPGFWYEIIQGALDKHDWSKGPIRIPVTFNDGHMIDFLLLAQNNPRNLVGALGLLIATHGEIKKIQVINYIKNRTGLKPNHLTATHSETAREYSHSTLGQHGRGLKVTACAALSGRHASSVLVESDSGVPQIGSWCGEMSMATDPNDPEYPAKLHLQYSNAPGEALTDQTIVTIANPSSRLIATLSQLPLWFLPTNPGYYLYPLANHSSASPSDSETTASPVTTTNDKLSAASSPEEKLHEARAEILDPKMLGLAESSSYDFVFVDGLRVSLRSYRVCNIYSFWGLGGDDRPGEKNANRSHDSRFLDGNIRELVNDLLIKCKSPTVFLSILTALHTDDQFNNSVLERNILLPLNRSLSAASVLKEAWEQFLKNENVAEGAVLAESPQEVADASLSGDVAIFINSFLWIDCLKKSVPNLETLGQKRMRLLEAELAKSKQELGIQELATPSGEVILLPDITADREDHLQLTMHQLIGMLATHGGRILSSDPDNNLLALEFSPDILKNRNYSSLDCLGPLREFVIAFANLFQDQLDLLIKVIDETQGSFFQCDVGKPLASGRAPLNVRVGSVANEGPSRVVIEMRTKKNSDTDSTQISNHPFVYNLLQNLATITDEEGGVSADAFAGSPLSLNHPATMALIKSRQRVLEAEAAREAQEAAAAALIQEQQGVAKRIQAAQAELELLQRKQDLTTAQQLQEQKRLQNEIIELEKQRETLGLLPYRADPEDIDPSLDKPAQKIQKASTNLEKPLILPRPNSSSFLSEDEPEQPMELVLEEANLIRRLSTRIKEAIKDALTRNVLPEFTLKTGREKTRPYLVSTISTITTAEYQVFQDSLPFRKIRGATHIVFHRPIQQGLFNLFCPPEYKPAAYYHPDGEQPLTFAGNPTKKCYAASSESVIPAGLVVYFAPDSTPDTSRPKPIEQKILADFDTLNPEWQELVNAVKEKPYLTSKEKVDIALTAWLKAFYYNDAKGAYDRYSAYRNGPDNLLNSQIINFATGNCGYAAVGFQSLLSLFGLPTRHVSSFLTDGMGRCTREHNSHGLVQVYIDDRWVTIEPQAGYISRGYKIESVTPSSLGLYLNKIQRAPSKKTRTIQDLPKSTLGAVFSNEFVYETVANLIALLKNYPQVASNPLTLIRNMFSAVHEKNRSNGGMLKTPELARRTALTLVYVGVPAVILTFLMPILMNNVSSVQAVSPDFFSAFVTPTPNPDIGEAREITRQLINLRPVFQGLKTTFDDQSIKTLLMLLGVAGTNILSYRFGKSKNQ